MENRPEDSPTDAGRQYKRDAVDDAGGGAEAESAHDRLESEAMWGEASKGESRWPATIAVGLAIALSTVLPSELIFGPRWLVPTLEAAVAVPLLVASPRRVTRESKMLRSVSIALIALVNIANFASLGALIYHLTHVLHGVTIQTEGRTLLAASVAIWLTNVIVFGLWYWELDRGGPAARMSPDHREPDFLFPQMTARAVSKTPWSPLFVDYFYTSFTNATAFSPTDTMPLTAWAKLLMTAQSMASLLTVALVAARAVNILS